MSESRTLQEQACEVPLIEQLRSIPVNYRTCREIQWAEDGTPTGHQFIPVGYMMHKAADELSAARQVAKRNEADAERYRWLQNQGCNLVPEGESRWLLERTYAKGQPAERREFWLGATTGNIHSDSFEGNERIWTTNALNAARFSSRAIADTLCYRHFHPESTVEAIEHSFQCGVTYEPAQAEVGELVKRLQEPFNWRDYQAAGEKAGLMQRAAAVLTRLAPQRHLTEVEQRVMKKALLASSTLVTEPQQSWIPVSERLPDVDGVRWMIWAIDNYGVPYLASEYYHFHEGWATDEHVTHWMPLPTPPAQSGKEGK